MNDQPVYSIDEFEVESKYIDTLIWEALAIEPDSAVLVCGYGPGGTTAKRAIKTGANVTVIEHRAEAINTNATLDAKLLRGSTSVIPAKDNSFDVAIAYHYLHEIDPFFHAQVLAELARVARRVAVVEPAPPADPLGKRIALIYSQAKRELGQFEYYQPMEYWKKMLQSVKADVSQNVFAFAKVPPRHYLKDTIELMLHTIEVEDAPREYMDELRTIAHRSESQMLPPPRYVLVGAAAGELIVPSFSKRPEIPVPLDTHQIVAKVKSARARQKQETPKPRALPQPQSVVSEDDGYEFPPVTPPAPPPIVNPTRSPIVAGEPHPQALPPSAPPPAHVEEPPAAAGFGFGMQPPQAAPPPAFGFGGPQPPPEAPPAVTGSPFGVPFAVPSSEGNLGFGIPPEGVPPTSTWAWEPPENPEGEETPPA